MEVEQLRYILARDGPGCACCPPGERGHWVSAPSWNPENFVMLRWSVRLEVDHIVPLWSVADLPDEERRPFFGPDNLWLLCDRHHKAKSAQEAADRAAGVMSWR